MLPYAGYDPGMCHSDIALSHGMSKSVQLYQGQCSYCRQCSPWYFMLHNSVTFCDRWPVTNDYTSRSLTTIACSFCNAYCIGPT